MIVYYGEALGRYGFGEGHPFGPDRLQAFWSEIVRQGLDRRVKVGTPRHCTESELLRFHTAAYVAYVKKRSKAGTGFLDMGDTPVFPGVFEAACVVVGTALAGLESVMNGSARRVFLPIGGLHHARRDAAAGFCVFNDIGVVIETLRRQFGVQRIGYVDIDVHHGDGVFYAFEDDPGLIFADIHEDGRYLYPGTGAASETGRGAARGTKLNLPLPPGAGDADFLRVWPAIEELLRRHEPEILLLQAGADSLRGDPLAHLAFTPACHRHAAARLCALADACCDGRLMAFGGGGYNLASLALAWTEVVKAMLEA